MSITHVTHQRSWVLIHSLLSQSKHIHLSVDQSQPLTSPEHSGAKAGPKNEHVRTENLRTVIVSANEHSKIHHQFFYLIFGLRTEFVRSGVPKLVHAMALQQH